MAAVGERVGDFVIEAPLGEGGMGAVYRAIDRRSGRAVALKRLTGLDVKGNRMAAHFEREYRVLSQLAHPSVIEVYDYGLDQGGTPFYTMELLDGSDLSTLSPLPQGRVCALFHDVASSLALLHARGFVHRDVTARNIRVLADDRAKLIDFGAIAPMGPCEEIIGTPVYVPPEAVLGQSLDGRSDLYSLGVAMYYALSGRAPYTAHRFSDLRVAWKTSPPPPEQFVEDVHRDLSQLTMALLTLDRSARPRSAAEVMERLTAIGGLDRGELPAASQSYLVAPTLENRAAPRRRLSRILRGALEGRGGALLFRGEHGVGRSRMLETTVLEARIRGASVVRLSALHSRGAAFDGCRALIGQILSSESSGAAAWAREHREVCGVLFAEDASGRAPTLSDFARQPRPAMIAAIRQLVLACAHTRPLVIAADDLPMLDEPTVAVLAALAVDARFHPLAIVGVLDRGLDALAYPSLSLLRDQSQVVTLSPLDEAATGRLMASVFGDAPHMEPWARRVHRMAGGRPREIMALMAHMVDAGIAQYSTGSWVLPAAVDQHPLPRTFEEALRERMKGLSSSAHLLAECHALSALPTLSVEQYTQLVRQDEVSRVYAAIDELLVCEVIQESHDGYVVTHEGWTSLIAGEMSDVVRGERHRDVARMHEHFGSDAPLIAYHLLLGGDGAHALELLEPFCAEFSGETLDVFEVTRLTAPQLGVMFGQALAALNRLGGGARLHARLRQFMLAVGTVVEPQWFLDAADDVQALLLRESGYDYWQTLDETLPPLERVTRAILHAQTLYDEASETGRYLNAAGAIRSLVMFTVASVAVSMATCDFRRLRTLPGLLRPFAVLSPLIDTIMKNVQAVVCTVEGTYDEAAELYREVLGHLEKDDVAGLEHADEIRAGVIFGMAVVEARMGMQSASKHLDVIADNPRMRGNVLGLRVVLAMQQGDWREAKQVKREARRLNVENEAHRIFGQDSLPAEVELYALGRDLDAVKQCLDELGQLARRYPTWQAVHLMAQGDYARLRGKGQKALLYVESCLMLCQPKSAGEGPSIPWHHAAASKIELLTELGRVEDALAYGESLICEGQPLGQRHHRVLRALALAEGRAGRHESAMTRLQALEQTLLRRGATGVELGLIYEALAWCSLWADDASTFRHYAALTADEYHRCSDSGFADRYARLRRALRGSALVSDIPPSQSVERSEAMSPSAVQSVEAMVSEAFAHCASTTDRAQGALTMLADLSGSATAFLFLRDSTQIVLASSLPGSAEGAGLLEYVASAWQGETAPEGDDVPTSMSTAGPMTTTQSGANAWRDPQGRAHHLLPIRAQVRGASRWVALAMLGGQAPHHWPPALLQCARVIGEALLRAGDVLDQDAGTEATRNHRPSP